MYELGYGSPKEGQVCVCAGMGPDVRVSCTHCGVPDQCYSYVALLLPPQV